MFAAMPDALVIGGGPAGLMAAEMLADRGHGVLVADAMPSMGRKLLMAGKSGLNLTKDEPLPDFLNAYDAPWLRPVLREFGPFEVQVWANGLGQAVFTGSSGRVFPVGMKASPLLRAWLVRLAGKGVQFRNRWRWLGWKDGATQFDTPQGQQQIKPRATVLALGGASWRRLGSDGAWADILAAQGVDIAPFQPANMGFNVAWSAHMARHFGAPVKPARLTVGDHSVYGEFVLSKTGIEGSAVYALSRPLRDGGKLLVDLFPDRSIDDLARRLAAPQGKASRANFLRKTIGLSGVKAALVNELARDITEPSALASVLKSLPMPLIGPRPLDEAISTAGGVRVTDSLMILPGVFCAGEMLDWEAPTGGYLLTACLATGRAAGIAAANSL